MANYIAPDKFTASKFLPTEHNQLKVAVNSKTDKPLVNQTSVHLSKADLNATYPDITVANANDGARPGQKIICPVIEIEYEKINSTDWISRPIVNVE